MEDPHWFPHSSVTLYASMYSTLQDDQADSSVQNIQNCDCMLFVAYCGRHAYMHPSLEHKLEQSVNWGL